jgi:hypothetical protein
VSADGRGDLFSDSAELEVHALAPAPDGGLYVGTSPDGRVYRVSAAGQAEPFFDPDDKYIWALATDARGRVYAATGDRGRVYRITPDGRGEVFFETKAAHAMTLAFDGEGRALIGTGGPGRVFRVDAAGSGFLLLDTPYQEVRALRLAGDGVIHAAALNGRTQGAPAGADSGDTPPAPPPPTPSVSTEIMSFAIIDVPVPAQASSSPGASGGGSSPAGAVYRIQPDGLWDAIAAVPLGVVPALRRDWTARGASLVVSAGLALPVFWFGLVLQLVFSLGLGWLPSSGRTTPGDGSMADRLAHLALPATMLAAVHAAAWSRYLRAGLGETLMQPFVAAARARGVAEHLVLLRHALRPALIPVVTIVFLDAALMLAGTVVTESVFAWPGLGSLFTEALARRDYTVLMALLMLSSSAVVGLNLVADLVYPLLDPRVRR